MSNKTGWRKLHTGSGLFASVTMHFFLAFLMQACLKASAYPLGSVAPRMTVEQNLLKDDPLKGFVSSITKQDGPGSGNQAPVRGNDIDDISVNIVPHRNIFAEPTSIDQHDDNDDGDHGHEHQEALLSRPSWFTSTLMARRLLALSTIGVASTTYPARPPPHSRVPSEVSGLSISLPEYYADCEGELLARSGGGSGSDEAEGNPILLGLYVSTTFRNVFAGSNISLSIDWWAHVSKTAPLYPDFPPSPAGLPRMSLLGYIETVPQSVPKGKRQALESCFLAAHPDAEAWLPEDPESPHAGFWAKMIVTQVHWIGGFGDTQQIGWINMTEWKGIRKRDSLPGIGDGRGWDDVRLVGEDEGDD